MKALCNNIRLTFDESDNPQITITTKLSRRESLEGVSALKEILNNDKLLEVEIKAAQKEAIS